MIEQFPGNRVADAADLPPVIQGGMGVGVSGWRLARAVAMQGQLGVVSGTALDLLLTRQLQLGDEGGHLRRALEAFPYPEIAARILDRYFIPGGKSPDAPFKTPPMISHEPGRQTRELVVAAGFVAIHLARQGHAGVVGLNLLEKIQTPTLMVLYGAMLAGVDVVLMGAGIPRQIPKILDDLAAGASAEMRLDVTGATEPVFIRIDPAEFGPAPVLRRPLFLAIVASPVLAENLRRKASGRVDGFVVEAPTAGGHNAPPRGPMQLTPEGEPIYGERDRIDPAKFVEIGLPFWLAGGYGRIGKLREARALGAHGIQVGTAFAFCEESGFDPALKVGILAAVKRGDLEIHTDALASPTGFPFKVAQVPGSIADPAVYQQRERVCDLGVLRETYQKPDGGIGFRCSAEPLDLYVSKGGDPEQTRHRICLCNSLCASAGIGQIRDGAAEPQLITIGDDLAAVRDVMSGDSNSYSAADVIRRLLD
ncbi:MAG: nitronate monooxygenase [Akkermansiaceae bacterium]|jgi:nitronate monooxygenase|nr:nitronate monooxygenase [Akkermansiaceae bacterium]